MECTDARADTSFEALQDKLRHAHLVSLFGKGYSKYINNDDDDYDEEEDVARARQAAAAAERAAAAAVGSNAGDEDGDITDQREGVQDYNSDDDNFGFQGNAVLSDLFAGSSSRTASLLHGATDTDVDYTDKDDGDDDVDDKDDDEHDDEADTHLAQILEMLAGGELNHLLAHAGSKASNGSQNEPEGAQTPLSTQLSHQMDDEDEEVIAEQLRMLEAAGLSEGRLKASGGDRMHREDIETALQLNRQLQGRVGSLLAQVSVDLETNHKLQVGLIKWRQQQQEQQQQQQNQDAEDGRIAHEQFYLYRSSFFWFDGYRMPEPNQDICTLQDVLPLVNLPHSGWKWGQQQKDALKQAVLAEVQSSATEEILKGECGDLADLLEQFNDAKGWTLESEQVVRAVHEFTLQQWARVVELAGIESRSPEDVKVFVLQELLPEASGKPKKGSWSLQEQRKLKELVALHGTHKWEAVGSELGRSAWDCLSMWVQKLAPDANKPQRFTTEEDDRLVAAVRKHGTVWKLVGAEVGRPPWACMHRWRENIAVQERKKGKWTAEEDEALLQAMERIGSKNWVAIAGLVPGRTGPQCRERWHNVLNPDINLDVWTKEEVVRIVKIAQDDLKTMGRVAWSKMMDKIPGRRDHDLKRMYLRLVETLQNEQVLEDPDFEPTDEVMEELNCRSQLGMAWGHAARADAEHSSRRRRRRHFRPHKPSDGSFPPLFAQHMAALQQARGSAGTPVVLDGAQATVVLQNSASSGRAGHATLVLQGGFRTGSDRPATVVVQTANSTSEGLARVTVHNGTTEARGAQASVASQNGMNPGSEEHAPGIVQDGANTGSASGPAVQATITIQHASSAVTQRHVMDLQNSLTRGVARKAAGIVPGSTHAQGQAHTAIQGGQVMGTNSHAAVVLDASVGINGRDVVPEHHAGSEGAGQTSQSLQAPHVRSASPGGPTTQPERCGARSNSVRAPPSSGLVPATQEQDASSALPTPTQTTGSLDPTQQQQGRFTTVAASQPQQASTHPRPAGTNTAASVSSAPQEATGQLAAPSKAQPPAPSYVLPAGRTAHLMVRQGATTQHVKLHNPSAEAVTVTLASHQHTSAAIQTHFILSSGRTGPVGGQVQPNQSSEGNPVAGRSKRKYSKGTNGKPRSKATNGKDSAKGTNGEDSAKGTNGEDDAQGANGEHGTQGASGDRGVQDANGEHGAKRPNGKHGAQRTARSRKQADWLKHRTSAEAQQTQGQQTKKQRTAAQRAAAPNVSAKPREKRRGKKQKQELESATAQPVDEEGRPVGAGTAAQAGGGAEDTAAGTGAEVQTVVPRPTPGVSGEQVVQRKRKQGQAVKRKRGGETAAAGADAGAGDAGTAGPGHAATQGRTDPGKGKAETSGAVRAKRSRNLKTQTSATGDNVDQHTGSNQPAHAIGLSSLPTDTVVMPSVLEQNGPSAPVDSGADLTAEPGVEVLHDAQPKKQKLCDSQPLRGPAPEQGPCTPLTSKAVGRGTKQKKSNPRTGHRGTAGRGCVAPGPAESAERPDETTPQAPSKAKRKKNPEKSKRAGMLNLSWGVRKVRQARQRLPSAAAKNWCAALHISEGR